MGTGTHQNAAGETPRASVSSRPPDGNSRIGFRLERTNRKIKENLSIPAYLRYSQICRSGETRNNMQTYEIEQFFEDEVRERTIIARSAGHMNRRRKIPNINNYTDTELRALNGPVRVYSMKSSECAPCRT